MGKPGHESISVNHLKWTYRAEFASDWVKNSQDSSSSPKLTTGCHDGGRGWVSEWVSLVYWSPRWRCHWVSWQPWDVITPASVDDWGLMDVWSRCGPQAVTFVSDLCQRRYEGVSFPWADEPVEHPPEHTALQRSYGLSRSLGCCVLHIKMTAAIWMYMSVFLRVLVFLFDTCRHVYIKHVVNHD